MTPEQQAREQISAASLRLKEATGQWNAVDLTAIGNCVETLEQTTGALTEALEILRDASPEILRSLQTDIKKDAAGLKENATRLERLADSSAAFLRCAPGAEGKDSGFYEPDGSIRYSGRCSAADAEARGIQA